MEIKEAFAVESGSGKLKGKPHAVFSMEVASGRLAGTKHRKLQILDTRDKRGRPVGLAILLSDLEIMGIKPKGMGDLEDAMGDAVGAIVEVAVVKNGQYTNTYINNLIQGGGSDRDDDEEEAEEEDDDTALEADDDEEVEEVPKKRGRPKGSKNKTAAAPKKAPKKPVDDGEFDDDIFD
jgi:hypothetical protein